MGQTHSLNILLLGWYCMWFRVPSAYLVGNVSNDKRTQLLMEVALLKQGNWHIRNKRSVGNGPKAGRGTKNTAAGVGRHAVDELFVETNHGGFRDTAEVSGRSVVCFIQNCLECSLLTLKGISSRGNVRG